MIFIPSSAATYIAATSYLALDEANQIIGSNPESGQWGNLGDEAKQFVLNQASLSVDGLFSYQNSKTDEAQLLKFPRNSLTAIPQAVKYATCSLSLSIAKGEAFKNVKAETIGKMSWEFHKSVNGATDEVVSYLMPYKMTGVRIT